VNFFSLIKLPYYSRTALILKVPQSILAELSLDFVIISRSSNSNTTTGTQNHQAVTHVPLKYFHLQYEQPIINTPGYMDSLIFPIADVPKHIRLHDFSLYKILHCIEQTLP
jgi:hypothetical protein